MNRLEQAFGQSFVDAKQEIRTRQFELGGHIFKVKIPLTVEYEAMQKRLATPDAGAVESRYTEVTRDLIATRLEGSESVGLEFKEDDILVHGKSMREAATNHVLLENRVTELFRLLVPQERDFDMSTIDYQMIDELFPLAIQLQVMEKISEVIAPGYKEARKN